MVSPRPIVQAQTSVSRDFSSLRGFTHEFGLEQATHDGLEHDDGNLKTSVCAATAQAILRKKRLGALLNGFLLHNTGNV